MEFSTLYLLYVLIPALIVIILIIIAVILSKIKRLEKVGDFIMNDVIRSVNSI